MFSRYPTWLEFRYSLESPFNVHIDSAPKSINQNTNKKSTQIPHKSSPNPFQVEIQNDVQRRTGYAHELILRHVELPQRRHRRRKHPTTSDALRVFRRVLSREFVGVEDELLQLAERGQILGSGGVRAEG